MVTHFALHKRKFIVENVCFTQIADDPDDLAFEMCAIFIQP